jgi:hypothetical protein
VKLPISTASAGVWAVESPGDLRRVAAHPNVVDTFRRGRPVLVQQRAEGPIAMAQTVFEHGRLVAAHAACAAGTACAAARRPSAPSTCPS